MEMVRVHIKELDLTMKDLRMTTEQMNAMKLIRREKLDKLSLADP